jgi:hypothetical protein
MENLTDAMCNEFRRMSCSFNDMIRHAYNAGADSLRAEVERLTAEVDKFRTSAGARRDEIERLNRIIEYHNDKRV